MNKPRSFLGSSGKQAKLLQAITRGLEHVVDVEPWTTTFNPGRSTLDRLVELSQEVDFAAFVFAQDDWTATDASQSGQASPRDNVLSRPGRSRGKPAGRSHRAARQDRSPKLRRASGDINTFPVPGACGDLVNLEVRVRQVVVVGRQDLSQRVSEDMLLRRYGCLSRAVPSGLSITNFQVPSA